MDLMHLTATEWQQGWHRTDSALVCNFCDQPWPLTTPHTALTNHIQTVHGGVQAALIHLDSRYNTLTVKQQALLMAFASGTKDKVVAEQLGVAPATVRHQKFTFRQKAKQAKLYLAIYDSVFASEDPKEQLIDVPQQPTDPDDRWLITEEEATKTVQRYFDFSTATVRLKRWPKKQKAIITILTRIINEIPRDRRLTEDQINSYLKPIYFDYPLIRRYLIDYNFLQRTTDGTAYWRPQRKE